jgi:hypothetical protein
MAGPQSRTQLGIQGLEASIGDRGGDAKTLVDALGKKPRGEQDLFRLDSGRRATLPTDFPDEAQTARRLAESLTITRRSWDTQ